jgi:hypothetical protein
MLLFAVNMQDLIPRKKGEMQGKERIEGGKQFFRCLRKMSWLFME